MYSKTSEDFQNQFPIKISIVRANLERRELSLQHRIFNKTSDLKEYWENKLDVVFSDDMEVWEGFHIENETLDLDKLKQEELV